MEAIVGYDGEVFAGGEGGFGHVVGGDGGTGAVEGVVVAVNELFGRCYCVISTVLLYYLRYLMGKVRYIPVVDARVITSSPTSAAILLGTLEASRRE